MDNTKVFETPEFMEELLRHLACCPLVVAKAQDCNLLAEDFVINDTLGVKIYKEFARILLLIKQAPVSPMLFMAYVKESAEANALAGEQRESAAKLIEYMFFDKSPLNSEFICGQLFNFIKWRRLLKVKITHINDVDKLVQEYTEVNNNLAALDTRRVSDVCTPFSDLVLKKERNYLIPTGLPEVDRAIGGLAKGELGLIVGFSGGGKTLVMTRMSKGALEEKCRVAVIELEEQKEDICYRFYSDEFNIPYLDLYQGKDYAMEEVAKRFNAMPEERKRSLMNLKIEKIESASVTCKSIISELERLAKETGFIPDVVFIDQLQFMSPDSDIGKNKSEWEKWKQVITELDKAASHKIMGVHGFALWVLHQAKGKKSLVFDRTQIRGYQGIIEPAAVVMMIGSDKTKENVMSVASEKVRHGMSFRAEYVVDPTYQRVHTERPINTSSALSFTNSAVNPVAKLNPNTKVGVSYA